MITEVVLLAMMEEYLDSLRTIQKRLHESSAYRMRHDEFVPAEKELKRLTNRVHRIRDLLAIRNAAEASKVAENMFFENGGEI